MKINKSHFLEQEKAILDQLKDSAACFLNQNNYGLVGSNKQTGSSIKTVITADNQRFLKIKVIQCRALCPGGMRIEILDEHKLPDFEINLTQIYENMGNNESETFYVALVVDPFKRKAFGELLSEEEPPRYPYTMPSYEAILIPEKQLLHDSIPPENAFPLGKLTIQPEKPEVFDDYIPACITISNHQELLEFAATTQKFFGQLELNVLSIICKINEKNQDTRLAQSVLSLSQNLLQYISYRQLSLQWQIPNSTPVRLFELIASSARVIRNTIDTNTAAGKEEMLNYFTNWSELKQGDFEKLLTYCINFRYHHFDILNSIEQFGEFIQIMSKLFDKLESLAYIGKKKETTIFVKEQKTKRSFLAD